MSSAPISDSSSHPRLKLDFLIGGVSKSGTSFLHNALMGNPEIYMPDREVTYFLPIHYSKYKMELLERELDRNKIVGIKRPDYIFNFNAIHNIRMSSGSGTKIIICLRDPVVRAISHFYHLRSLAQIRFCSFRKLVDTLVEGDLLSLGLRAYEIDLHSRYADAVENCRRLFGGANVKLVNFEEMVASPQEVLDDVCRFLGVGPHQFPSMPSIPQKVMYSEKSQIYLAKAARLEGYCDRNGVVLGYRQPPHSYLRRWLATKFRDAAKKHRGDEGKPSFPAEELECLRVHFSDEYAYLRARGFHFTELKHLVVSDRCSPTA